MSKFDPDFAIFATVSADIDDRNDIGASIIDYANAVSKRLYGELKGKKIVDLLSEISDHSDQVKMLITQLSSEEQISFEGRLNGRDVKLHSRIVSCPSELCLADKSFIQAAIIDITDSNIVKKALYGTSEALRRAAEAADEDTGFHVARINYYSNELSKKMGLDSAFCEKISKYAQLHDIGKIKVAEIIRMPRKLTDDEFEQMKQHTIFGAEMIGDISGLEMACDIAMDHHEKWDGSGYPSGKQGEEISLSGRIVAIADVFDALVSKRAYKPAFSYEKTYQIISKGDGRVLPEHFDPEILKIFTNNYDLFVSLHKKLKD